MTFWKALGSCALAATVWVVPAAQAQGRAGQQRHAHVGEAAVGSFGEMRVDAV